MATLLLNDADATLANLLRTEAKTALEDGVSIDSDANGTGDLPYCSTVVPVASSALAMLNTPTAQTAADESLQLAAVPYVKHFRQIAYHAEKTSFAPQVDLPDNTPVALLTVTLSALNRPSVDRQAMAVVNLSAFSQAINQRIRFWLAYSGNLVSGTTTEARFWFNEASEHLGFGFNWAIDLPAGTSTVTLYAANSVGTGTITLNSDDCAALTVWA